MKYGDKALAAVMAILLLAITVPTFGLWSILYSCSSRLGRWMAPPVSLLLIAFAAVLALGTYRDKGQTFLAQYSLHALAIASKLRELYPKAF